MLATDEILASMDKPDRNGQVPEIIRDQRRPWPLQSRQVFFRTNAPLSLVDEVVRLAAQLTSHLSNLNIEIPVLAGGFEFRQEPPKSLLGYYIVREDRAGVFLHDQDNKLHWRPFPDLFETFLEEIGHAKIAHAGWTEGVQLSKSVPPGCARELQRLLAFEHLDTKSPVALDVVAALDPRIPAPTKPAELLGKLYKRCALSPDEVKKTSPLIFELLESLHGRD